ncbi:hypothetical protein KIPB_014591, partial [Kipferlia bialata]|eukprot:g14591.t1
MTFLYSRVPQKIYFKYASFHTVAHELAAPHTQ